MEMWPQVDERVSCTELWLDSLDQDLIRLAESLGILKGVTTNPSLLSHSRLNLKDEIERLLDLQSGFVAVQVTARDHYQMIQQARLYHDFSSERVIVKIPATLAGFQALKACRERHIPTMATGVVSLRQALMAGLMECDYVALYLGTMNDHQLDPFELIQDVDNLYKMKKIKTKILGASIHQVDWVIDALVSGCHCVTMSGGIFEAFLQDHPLTVEKTDKMLDIWQHATSGCC